MRARGAGRKTMLLDYRGPFVCSQESSIRQEWVFVAQKVRVYFSEVVRARRQAS